MRLLSGARLYNQAAAELEGVAPHAWYAHAGAGARFLIMLDDIVDAGGRPYALADDCDLAHAQGLVDAFAALHARLLGEPAVDRRSVLGPNLEHPHGLRPPRAGPAATRRA